ncbi:hypothetical protein [Sedimentisphaera cyanobacteriorum]|uniref:hypothetical protein n=1 Tax=Sedimentisphaera cyanobacteriorum TaxID=1940790 RepID=UPI000984BCFA|nr:hypothetical protein [Sedimentisphaera cyanobacteriorum]
MSKLKSPSYAEKLSAAHRRAILVEMFSEAACRLAGISVNSPKSGKNLSENADSALTGLDVSGKTRLHVSIDKPLEHKEL